MGIQKYRFDKEYAPDEHGVIECVTVWIGGPSLAGLRNCPCSDGKRRTVYITGDADTFWTMPAAVAVKGKRVVGYVSRDGFKDANDEHGWMFHSLALES